jgi:hypothetical protein
MRALLAATVLFCLAPAGAAFAQTTQSDPIVVTGRTPEQTQSFVERVAAVPSADQLARWDRVVCPSVAGLPARQGQFLADRIAQRAAALGLEPGAAGCQGNVAVFVTNDSDAMARQLFEQDPSLFAYLGGGGLVTLGRGAFDAQFLNSQRAVRWWHVSETIGADGRALHGDASQGGFSNAPMARAQGTRLRNETRQDFARVIIIVDARRVGGANLTALGDYIAMVALAQIDPGADTAAFPTVLNLFNAPAGQAVTGMTDWDLAYLGGLYNATRSAVNAQQQRREISRHMQSGAGGSGQP